MLEYCIDISCEDPAEKRIFMTPENKIEKYVKLDVQSWTRFVLKKRPVFILKKCHILTTNVLKR